jgi:beta-phosphoglucomutase-like phosphatase (HAD superfamily)
VVFDLDGLLVDSIAVFTPARLLLAGLHGRTVRYGRDSPLDLRLAAERH